jgi:hypothetical protein
VAQRQIPVDNPATGEGLAGEDGMTATRSRKQDATSRSGYLHEVAALLWPESTATLTGMRGTAAAECDQYLVLPHARHPRLIVPRHGPAAAAAVAGFNAGRSRRAWLVSGPLRAVLRHGAGSLIFRDRMFIRPAGDTLQSHLSGLLGQELLLAVQLSPPRANRKPVVQLLDQKGTIIGFAKVGVNELTRRLIRHEAAALEIVRKAGTTAVTPPAVWHFGHWRDTDILVLRPLPSWHQVPGHAAGPLLRTAMTEVAGISGIARGPLGDSAFWLRICTELDALGERGAPFRRVLGQLAESDGRTVLGFGSWHGDWTRTNVAPHGDSVLAWDWERFGTDVPIGFDALHYDLLSSITVRHRPLDQAVAMTVASAERLLAPFGVGKAQDRRRLSLLTAALYLAELAGRYLHDRQDETSEVISDPERWMLPGLAAVVGDLT